MADPAVVLVVPTVQDGTVVRWYQNLLAARNGRPMAMAWRTGVTVELAPREIAMKAYDVHELLAADRTADVSDLATHERGGFGNGDLVPVEPPKKAFRITIADRFGGAPR